jgi:hypothetical protein
MVRYAGVFFLLHFNQGILMGLENRGGLIICRPKPIPYKSGDSIGFRLMSDLHIGAPNIDYHLIKNELEDAKRKNDRILLNGDVFDMILPKDAKRFDASHVHPRLFGRGDIVNAQIEWGVDLLEPYVDQIDMIGVGNHETAVTKYHSTDPTLLLVHELQKMVKADGHRIHYGGYGGFVDYRMRIHYSSKKEGGTQRFLIYYHHGAGGAAPVTKGMINLHRTGWIHGADLIWQGHRHVRVHTHVQSISCPLVGTEPAVQDIRQIITGSYFDTYCGQSQGDLKKNGRRASWAADVGFAPQGKGGTRIRLDMTYISGQPKKDLIVEQ